MISKKYRYHLLSNWYFTKCFCKQLCFITILPCREGKINIISLLTLGKLDKEKSRLFSKTPQPVDIRADPEFSTLYTWMNRPIPSRVEKKFLGNITFDFTGLLEEKKGEGISLPVQIEKPSPTEVKCPKMPS